MSPNDVIATARRMRVAHPQTPSLAGCSEAADHNFVPSIAMASAGPPMNIPLRIVGGEYSR
jgi:hypothetical protein